MADGIYATMDTMQAPGRHPALDRSPADAEPQQLPMRDHAMLPMRQLRDPSVTTSPGTNPKMSTHSVLILGRVGHGAPAWQGKARAWARARAATAPGV